MARLAYLQLFTDRYALNAANTSIKIEYVIPQRGVIFDRNGKIMVGNQPAYEISFTQALMKPDFDTLGFCNLMKISKSDFINKVNTIKKEKYYSKLTPMTLLKTSAEKILQEFRKLYLNIRHSVLFQDHSVNTKFQLPETF